MDLFCCPSGHLATCIVTMVTTFCAQDWPQSVWSMTRQRTITEKVGLRDGCGDVLFAWRTHTPCVLVLSCTVARHVVVDTISNGVDIVNRKTSSRIGTQQDSGEHMFT